MTANGGERFGDGRLRTQRHMFGSHQAAGALLWVREQLLHIVALLFRHQAQDLLAAQWREFGNGVGRLVGAHLFQQISGALWLQVFEQVGARLRLQLLERLSRDLFIKGVKDVGAVARRQLINNGCKVGRVQLGETGVWHAEANTGDGGAERIDILPINVRGDARLLAREAIDPGVREAESAQQSGGANIDGDQAHRPLNEVEDDVVGTHDLTPVNVNDLLIKKVALQQDLVVAASEATDVDARRQNRGPCGIHALHAAPAEIDATAPGSDHEPGDWRVARTHGGDEVIDDADRVGAAVAHGLSNKS